MNQYYLRSATVIFLVSHVRKEGALRFVLKVSFHWSSYSISSMLLTLFGIYRCTNFRQGQPVNLLSIKTTKYIFNNCLDSFSPIPKNCMEKLPRWVNVFNNLRKRWHIYNLHSQMTRILFFDPISSASNPRLSFTERKWLDQRQPQDHP